MIVENVFIVVFIFVWYVIKFDFKVILCYIFEENIMFIIVLFDGFVQDFVDRI